jgi:hypothetical protein
MTGIVVVDASLLVLLVVGSASTEYIAKHKRLRDDYTRDDFELLGLIIAEFSEIVLLPHILAEVSSLVKTNREPRASKNPRYPENLDHDCDRASNPKCLWRTA